MSTQATLTYYNQNARQFADTTLSVDFTATQNRFLKRLSLHAKILDFGCGAGRDTKYFLEQGYQVEAIDGSEELCKLAESYTGIQVKHMLFQELCAVDCYDGIWACSSILHLPYQELREVLLKMAKALKPQGIIYASFKYGSFQGERKGRYFTDFTEESFETLRNTVEGLFLVEQWVSRDVRPGRGEERWLNLILQKN